LLQLQRLAGNQAVCKLIANAGKSPLSVQRAVTYGTDPKTLINAGQKDLLYGINFQRGLTKARLSPTQKQELRTIDDYNRGIGINALITANNAAMGLYQVRAALARPAPWTLATPQPLDATNPNQGDLINWIAFLSFHSQRVGLEDLGAKGGFWRKDKINTKDRFKKNRKQSQATAPVADRLTARDVRNFLDPANTQVDALNLYTAMTAAKKTALNEWVYRAFFRRTSKLGQDFTIAQGGKIHFNTTADPNYNPVTRVGGQAVDRGLNIMSKTGQNAKNRAITISELRHMKKLAKLHPGSFNVYGER
jgi:hypothetical protein